MKIKPLPVVIFGMAIIVALLVAIMSYNRVQRKIKTQAKSPVYQTIAVASIDMSWGTTLNGSMIKMVPYLKESLPSGYFSDSSALDGRTIIYPIRASEPIFESKLAPTTMKGGGVAAVVTPKKRAMSVKVDRVIGISGFIQPGNRVDVLVTLAQKAGSSASITKTVLENVLVLATGPELGKNDKQEKPTQVEVITLEVTPEEGEKLALATTEGNIQLALRNFTDTENVITKGTTIPTLLTSYAMVREVKSTPAQAGQQTFSVELIRGSTMCELIF